MFKLAVETSKLSHVIAYSHGVDENTLQKLQGKYVDEVKRINGAVNFEDVYNYQRERLEKVKKTKNNIVYFV